MPAKPKVTREGIVDAAFTIARDRGVEGVNARTVSERLGCSTQPVMYHFATMEELKRVVYARADWYHTEYLMEPPPPGEDPMLEIGVNYIRFAIREPHLFRFLFQSGFARENSLLEMIDSEELIPVLAAMGEAMGMEREKTKKIFLTIALFAHGYASIIANNALEYDEALVKSHLEQAYRGAVLAVKEEEA